MLILAKELHKIDKNEADTLYIMAEEISKILSGLINTL
jgi:hypothetical protein